jgi:hypothetical protein
MALRALPQNPHNQKKATVWLRNNLLRLSP